MDTPRGYFLGLCVVDVVHRVNSAIGTNEKVTADSGEVVAGGPATNAALTFAYLGGQAQLVTAVGTGGLAEVIHAELDAAGVELYDLAAHSDVAPNVSSVVVNQATAERSVVSLDGIGNRAHLKSAAPIPAAEQVVMLDGHYPDQAISALHATLRHPRIIILDAGRWKPQFAQLIPLASEIVCSADFNIPSSPEADVANISKFDDIAQYCFAAGAKLVAQTNGAEAIEYILDTGERGYVPVPRLAPVDTLGAGDTFHGAYTFFRAVGHDYVTSLHAAAKVATLRCSFLGSRTWTSHIPSDSFVES